MARPQLNPEQAEKLHAAYLRDQAWRNAKVTAYAEARRRAEQQIEGLFALRNLAVAEAHETGVSLTRIGEEALSTSAPATRNEALRLGLELQGQSDTLAAATEAQDTAMPALERSPFTYRPAETERPGLTEAQRHDRVEVTVLPEDEPAVRKHAPLTENPAMTAVIWRNPSNPNGFLSDPPAMQKTPGGGAPRIEPIVTWATTGENREKLEELLSVAATATATATTTGQAAA